MYWTCGQCCVFHTYVVLASNIAIRSVLYWTCGQCCVFMYVGGMYQI